MSERMRINEKEAAESHLRNAKEAYVKGLHGYEQKDGRIIDELSPNHVKVDANPVALRFFGTCIDNLNYYEEFMGMVDLDFELPPDLKDMKSNAAAKFSELSASVSHP